MLVPDRVRRGVDDADRIVVVVGYDQCFSVLGDAKAAGIRLNADADPRIAVRAAVAQGDRRSGRECAALFAIDIDGIIVATRGVDRVAIRCPDQAGMGVRLLDHLGQHGRRLVGAGDIIQEDVLGRIRRVDHAGRFVEGVLTRADDRQRAAVRAELRPHRHAGHEVRVGGKTWIEELLNRAGRRLGCHVLSGWQRQRAVVAVDCGVVFGKCQLRCCEYGGREQRRLRQS